MGSNYPRLLSTRLGMPVHRAYQPHNVVFRFGEVLESWDRSLAARADSATKRTEMMPRAGWLEGGLANLAGLYFWHADILALRMAFAPGLHSAFPRTEPLSFLGWRKGLATRLAKLASGRRGKFHSRAGFVGGKTHFAFRGRGMRFLRISDAILDWDLIPCSGFVSCRSQFLVSSSPAATRLEAPFASEHQKPRTTRAGNFCALAQPRPQSRARHLAFQRGGQPTERADRAIARA